MKFGYARISTPDQKIDLQIDSLVRAGVRPENIYTDTSSGAKAKRTGLDKMLTMLRPGDEVIVWRLDRLARSLSHMLKLIEGWEHDNITFKSVMEPQMDTSSAYGKMILQISGVFAELEKNILKERTIAGLAKARKEGRVGGRKKGLSKEAQRKARIAESMYKEGTATVNEICDAIQVKSKATLYKYLRFRGIDPGKLVKREKIDYTQY